MSQLAASPTPWYHRGPVDIVLTRMDDTMILNFAPTTTHTPAAAAAPLRTTPATPWNRRGRIDIVLTRMDDTMMVDFATTTHTTAAAPVRTRSPLNPDAEPFISRSLARENRDRADQIRSRLKKRNPKSTMEEEDGEICAVCHDMLEKGDGKVAIMACKHEYHVDCITDWLVRKTSCPVCRAAVKL